MNIDEKWYAVVARNAGGDWRVLKDVLTITEARQYRDLQKKDYEIIRIYKFIEGDI